MPKHETRPARPDERLALIELQRRASLTHEAYRALLLHNPDAIDLPIEHIAQGGTLVATIDAVPAGFAVVITHADGTVELDGLFVEPRWARMGIGRRLVREACCKARQWGAATLIVVASPETQGFYAGCGFVVIGKAKTRFGKAVTMHRHIADG
ncbi:GNAT family N-acetyltransferase [Ensifer sp. HO-A22]|uniref:GNAT family N-acetyltransferase n=1 Tax=Ensifer oleiphilus TaxID=2742698 RepID=A0A7Y6Q499_9HYPH|nr:GNAT family N-acetyltransferase [Ensifer oleiphilus]NVD38798.1 GNAT family N-acetyltransferase [Ensifer oleiphilus]